MKLSATIFGFFFLSCALANAEDFDHILNSPYGECILVTHDTRRIVKHNVDVEKCAVYHKSDAGKCYEVNPNNLLPRESAHGRLPHLSLVNAHHLVHL